MVRPRVRLVAVTVFSVVLGLGGLAERPATPIPGEAGLARLDALPAGCSLEEVARIVAGFLDAFNRGDLAALDRLFPDEVAPEGVPVPGKFHWFSVTTDGPGGFSTFDPAELQQYFAERHAQDERLELRELQVVPSEDGAEAGVVGVTYRLTRRADDLPAATTMDGKGSIDCATARIHRWAMGDPPAELTGPTPPAAPAASEVDLLWALRAQAKTLVYTSAVDDAVRRLLPGAEYTFLFRAEVERLAEPLVLVAAGYEQTGGDAAADARSVGWRGTVVDDVAGGSVHVYAGEQLVVLYLGDDPAAQALLAELLGPPLAGV